MTTRIYIGSSISNKHRVENLYESLRWDKNLEFTYRWFDVGQVPLDRYAEVSEQEYLGVTNADVFIMLCPGRKGSHTELGIAMATVPYVFVAGTKEELEPTASDYPSIFYYHHRVMVIEYDGSYEHLVLQCREALNETVYRDNQLQS